MKRAIISALALLSSLFTANAVVDLGSQSSATPYDKYLGPVRTVLAGLDAKKANMDDVKTLMKKGRAFHYHMDNPYTPSMPDVTAREREGDCKDKALWLCDQLNDSSVRFVIGKTSPRAKMSHAWVMWQNEGRWWILDCTLKNAPVAADTLPSDAYIPLYSYAKNGRYRHAATQIGVAAVAAQKNAAVGQK
jgi:hypothetical protein